MIKCVLSVLVAAVLLVGLTGCDSGTPASTVPASEAAQLDPGIEPGKEPDPSQLTPTARPGGNLGKSTSTGE